MGYITIAMIALFAIAIIFGILFGLSRGFSRSFIRLVLVCGSVAGAVFLREPVVNFVLEMEAVKGLINPLLSQMPQSYHEVVYVLLSIVASVLIYFVLFFILRGVSWVIYALIFSPIIKMFFGRKGKKIRLLGALFGLIQGAVIAFAVLVPLNGLIIQADKISNVKLEIPTGAEESTDPKALLEVPKEFGLKEYTSSQICITLNEIGGWYFDMISTVKTKTGSLNFNDVSDITVGVADILDSTTTIRNGVEKVMKGEIANEEKAQTFKDIGAKISSIGGNFENLSDDAKKFMDDLISSALSDNEINADISVEELKFDSLGEAFTSLGNYYEDEKVDQAEANQIVKAIIENWAMVESVFAGGTENGTLINMEGENEEFFRNAIEEMADDTQKEKIMEMFGVPAL